MIKQANILNKDAITSKVDIVPNYITIKNPINKPKPKPSEGVPYLDVNGSLVQIVDFVRKAKANIHPAIDLQPYNSRCT